MRESDLLKELTGFDKTTLEGKDEYVSYFRYLRETFSKLMESYRARAVRAEQASPGVAGNDPREIAIMESFIERFLYTIEAYRMKYLCEPEVKMRFDPTDSSFPNHIEFRELEADIKRRDQMLRELPAEETLKQAILDSLFKRQQAPPELLRQLGRRKYFLLLQERVIRQEKMGQGGLFREFTPGKLEVLQDVGNSPVRRYLYSWGSYDVLTNRPHIYLLIVDQRAANTPLHKDPEALAAFEKAIRQNTNNTSPLKVIAHDIDEQFPHLYPKVVKRTDLGPLYGRYSVDEHLYTKMLKEHFQPADRVFSFTTEIIFSIGEKRSKSFLSKGDLRQIFFVDQSNAEAMERHVSEVHRYMLATHGVVQYLNDNHQDRLRKLAMPPITFIPGSAGAN